MKILKEKATNQEELKENQYFALMVTDHENKFGYNKRPKEDYLNFRKGWIGIERTSEGLIYISKDYSKRHDVCRGDTIIVEVEKKDKTCLLTY